jgi:WD40 repeat protein
LSFSPDGKLLAGGCAGGEVHVWRVAGGKLLRRLQEHEQPVMAVAFSRDGRRLHSVAFQPSPRFDQATELRAEGGEVCRWDVATGKLVRSWKGPQNLANEPMGEKVREVLVFVALSPAGDVIFKGVRRIAAEDGGRSQPPQLVALGGPGVLRATSTATGRQVFEAAELPAGTTQPPVFTADGKRFALSGTYTCLLDASSGVPLLKLKDPLEVNRALAFAPDGRTLATFDGALGLCLWDTGTGGRLKHIPCPPAGQHSFCPLLCFAADGNTIAGAIGPAVFVWDVATGKERQALDGHRAPVTHIGFAADGQRLVSTCGGRQLEWEAGTGRQVAQVSLLGADQHERVQGEAMWIRPHGAPLVVTQAKDGFLRLRESAGGKSVCILQGLKGEEAGHAELAPNGRFLGVLTTTRKKTLVRVFAVDCGMEIGRVVLGEEKREEVAEARLLRLALKGTACDEGDTLAVSPDGRHLAWPDGKGGIAVASLATGKILYRLGRKTHDKDDEPASVPQLLLFTPDGRRLATLPCGHDRASNEDPEAQLVRLWDVATGHEVQRLAVRTPGGDGARVSCAAFSSDGRTLALGAHGEARVGLWEIASGRRRRELAGHTAPVLTLAFAPDGRTLASGSEDGTVLVWDVRGTLTTRPGLAAGRSTADLVILWSDLASVDASRADRARRLLLQDPACGVAFLRERLRPAAPPAPGHVARLIAELNNPRFAVRDRAAQELRRVGQPAEAHLRAARAGAPAGEARRRLDQLLRGLQSLTPPGERLREVRAVEVLEQAGTAEARQLLEELARGMSEARLTQEARASAQRLAHSEIRQSRGQK